METTTNQAGDQTTDQDQSAIREIQQELDIEMSEESANESGEDSTDETERPMVSLKFSFGEKSRYSETLIDTGAMLSLVSINHPLIQAVELIRLHKNVRLKGAFSGKSTVRYCVEPEISGICAVTNEIIPLGKIRLFVVETPINVSTIIGYRDATRNLGLKISKHVTFRNKRLLSASVPRPWLTKDGNIDSVIGSLAKVRVVFPFTPENNYMLVDKNKCDAYNIEANCAVVPNGIDWRNMLVEPYEKCDFSDIHENLTDSVINAIKVSDKDEFPPLDVEKANIGPDLTNDQKTQVKDLISEFKDIFSKSAFDLGEAKGEYELNLSSEMPQAARIFPLSDDNKRLVGAEIEKMLQSGVIEEAPNASVVTSVFIPIRKEDGTYRLVNDLRSANTTILPSNLQLPKLSDILSKMANFKYYCCLDVSKAYWQVNLKKSQRRLFTVQNPVDGRVYQFKKMVMGCKTATAAFHTLAVRLLYGGIPSDRYVHYVDDNCLMAQSFEEMLQLLRKLLSNYRASGFKLNYRKCHFVQSSVRSFGYVVSSEGVEPDPKKVAAFDKLKVPSTVKMMQQSLGAMNYYRQCLPNYAFYSAPLYDAIAGKKGKIEVTPQLVENWKKLISALKNFVLLNRPDLQNGTFILESDSSDIACGAVLKQQQGNSEVIIGVFS